MTIRLLRLFALAAALFCVAPSLFAQGTAFTYQGCLNDGSGPANGTYDLTFTLQSAISGPAQVGAALTNSAVLVSNGLFTVSLDFGNQFPGPDRWLEISVRTNGAGAFTILAPRQQMTPSPYAVFSANAATASTASTASSVAAANISGTIQAANIASGSINSSMLANGSVGSNQLAVGAVTTPALGIESVVAAQISKVTNWVSVATLSISNSTGSENFGISAAPLGSSRVLVGAYFNNTGASGAGAAYLFSSNGTLLTTFTNPTPASFDNFGWSVSAFGTDRVLIGAGADDGGADNGGADNGGADNGGADNGGADNGGAAYLYSTNGVLLTTFTKPNPSADEWFGRTVAALGESLILISAPNEDAAVPNAGAAYLFETNGTLITTFTNPSPAANDYFGHPLLALGGDRVLIGAPYANRGAQDAGLVYLFNTNGALIITITNPSPGGFDRFGWSIASLGDDRLLIGAPEDSTYTQKAGAAYLFTTNGTLLNTFYKPGPPDSNYYAFFGASVSTIGGDRVLIGAPGDSTSAVNAGAAYLFNTNGVLINVLANPTPAPDDSFGSALAVLGNDRVLVGAANDDIAGNNSGAAYVFSTETYTAGLVTDAIRANGITTVNILDGSITAAKLGPAIGVWTRSGANVYRQSGNVGIGKNNPATALDVNGTVTATGFSGTGAGLTGLSAANVSSGTLPDVRLSANVALRTGGNTFNGNQVVTNGSVGIGTNAPVSPLHVVGTVTATAFNPTSDRNAKENFVAVSSRDVLEKVAGLSISRWNFKGDTATPHVGPMAQDFHAAFGLGTDDRHIATVDADGVALAAIQGLNQKFEEREASLRTELKRRDAENAELKARLEKLERLMEAKGGAR